MNFFEKMLEVAKGMGVKNFAYYKKWALDHLKKQVEEDETVTKALEYCEEYLEKAYGVGTIRTWKGKKYIKGSDKKWRRYYDKHERGTNLALNNVIRQLQKIDNMEDLAKFININRARFVNENGLLLPEAQEILKAGKEKGNGIKEERKPKAYNKDPESRSNQEENKRDKRIGNVALWDGRLKSAIKSGDAEKIKSTMAEIEKEFNEAKGRLKGDELDFAETEYKFRKRDADKAISDLDGKEKADPTKEDSKEDLKAENQKKEKKDPTKEITEGSVVRFKENLESGDENWIGVVLEDRGDTVVVQDVQSKMTIKPQHDYLKKDLVISKDAYKERDEMIDGPYGRKFTVDQAKKEIEGQIRYLQGMKENIGKQPKGKLAKDTENFIENLMGKLKPEDRKDLEVMYDIYKNGGKEKDTHYWIQDSKGNRLTNIDAKKRIKNNLDQIDSFNNLMEGRTKAENARTEIAKRSLEVDNNRLMERLNAEDRKEMKSEFEKHQNRSNAMKGNDNAKKDGISDEDEKELQINVDGVKNAIKGKSETEVKKYFNWAEKRFADKPENSIERRAIARAKADYYGDLVFEGTELETVVNKYASDKDIKNLVKKTDSMSFTSDDETKPFLSGTYHENGYRIATEGHILSMIKEDYPKEDEGKIKGNPNIIKYIGKKIENLKSRLPGAESKLEEVAQKQGTGTHAYEVFNKEVEDIKKEISDLEEQKNTGYVNTTFPNYKKVIPSMGNNSGYTKAEGFDDFNKVLKTAMVAAAYKKNTKSPIATTIKVGNSVFNAEKLEKVMAMAKKHGLTEILGDKEDPTRPIEFKGEKGSIVIMPMYSHTAAHFDANTGTMDIEDKEKSEEFLTGGERETRLTFAKNKQKFETKFDKDVMDIMNHFEKQKGFNVSKYNKNHNYIRAVKSPDHVTNDNNEDFRSAMNDLKDLYQDYQGFITDIYNKRFEEGKENKDVSSKEIKIFFEDGIRKIKDKYGIKKSFSERIEEIMNKSNPDVKKKHDLEYYKKWALSVLSKQSDDTGSEDQEDGPNEDTIVKALEYCEMMLQKAFPVGTVREWKGQKYIKIAPNKWKPKYDNMNSRGAKMSLSNLKKAVAKCNSEEELYNLMNSNASRFRDPKTGYPFPEVQELHDLVMKRGDEISNTSNNASGEPGKTENKEPENGGGESKKDQKSKKYSDAIAAIQNGGNKVVSAENKLAAGRPEDVVTDAGEDVTNNIKNASKKEEQEKKKESFESLTEQYNATKDPDEREKILNKIMTLDKEKNDTINDMKEEIYEDMGYSEKTKEEIDNMDRAEFSEYMRREQKSIPMDKIGRGGGRITNFDNAYNVCKKIAETYGVSDEGVKKLQDFMTYNTDTASRLHDELNEKMGMSYELLDADYDMAYKNALKQLLGKKTNGDSDKEKIAVDKYHGKLGAAARKYL